MATLARLQELGDQAGPAGLVRGAHAAAGVAVEIFVEQDVILEMRVGLRVWDDISRRAAGRPSPCKNNFVEAAREFVGHRNEGDEFPEPVGHSILKSSP